MKKILISLLILFPLMAIAQGGIYSCDFSDDDENALWARNGRWQITYVSAYSTGKNLLIQGYNGSYINPCTASRVLSLNEGTAHIGFSWQMGIPSNCGCSYMFLIALVPVGQSLQISGINQYQLPEGAVLVATQNNITTYSEGLIAYQFSRNVTIPETGNYRLTFVWANNCDSYEYNQHTPNYLVRVGGINITNTESYQTSFENNDTSLWYYTNDGGSTNWHKGGSISSGGENSLYISSDGGVTSSYINTLSSFACAYHKILAGTGTLHISYDWRANGEPSGDYLRAFLVPFSQSLDSIGLNLSSVTLPSNAIPLDNNQALCGQSSWNHFSTTFNVTNTEPQYYKVVFLWVNNGNGIGNNPPAAIDNVAINSRKTLSVVPSDTYHCSIMGSGVYDYMDTAAINVTPSAHYHVTRIGRSATGNMPTSVCNISSNRETFAVVMDSNYSLQVDVAIDTHTVQVNSRLNYGSVSVTNNGLIPYGQVCTVTADTSNSNYRFYTWSNGVTSNPYTFVVTQDTSLTAIYIIPNESHLLQVVSSDSTMGQVSINGDCIYQDLYQEGNVSLTATPNYGYHFVQWSDGITANPRTLNLTQDTYLTAIFAINQYTISLSTNDVSMGTTTGAGSYDYLSQITISAIASSHCHFVQWNDGSTSNPRPVTVTQNMSFTAIFAQDPQYSINVMVNDPSRGSVTGGGIYYAGEYATLSAEANEHYYFSSWSDGVTANPYYLTVIDNASYTAFFEPMNYTVNLTTNDDYMGSVYGGGAYPYGSTADIEAQPFDGFRFIEWSDGNNNASRTLTVLDDISLQARFGDANVNGIDDIDGHQYSIKVYQGRIIVEGIDANRVQIFDIVGRHRSNSEQLPMGVYMVRIGNVVTKKVVVM